MILSDVCFEYGTVRETWKTVYRDKLMRKYHFHLFVYCRQELNLSLLESSLQHYTKLK